MPYFDADTYNYLYGYLYSLREEAGFETLYQEFAGYFSLNQTTGNYVCTDLDAYTSFVNSLGPDAAGEFLNFGGTEQIKSTQGGGVF